MSIPGPRTQTLRRARAPVPAPEEYPPEAHRLDRPELRGHHRPNQPHRSARMVPAQGHIERGETRVEAAGREIAEETGITGYPVASSYHRLLVHLNGAAHPPDRAPLPLRGEAGGELSIDNDPDRSHRRRVGPTSLLAELPTASRKFARGGGTRP